MDANRFDTLSRQLGTTQPRRGVLRLVGALPLLGALGSLRSEPAGAQTPLDQVQDRAEQRADLRQRRNDRDEQRKGKRKGDGGGDGDGKNDGGGDGVNLGAPAPGSGECPGGVMINGGCFYQCDRKRIVDACRTMPSAGDWCPACSECSGCQAGVYGDDWRDEYELCVAETPGPRDTRCSTSADCPSGQACAHRSPLGVPNKCVAACYKPLWNRAMTP
jgi:hypothetical protein